MKVERLVRGLSLGIFAVKLATLAVNAVQFPRLRRTPQMRTQPQTPRASLLIPARNEAHNLRSTLPLLLEQGALEVLVLDDGSTDGTGEVAHELGARVLDGTPLPAGWVGKPWACQQLAQAAAGEVLVFTDADVQWHTGALDALLAELERSGAGLLSVFPHQDNRTVGERLLTPAIDTVILTLFPAALLEVPQPSAATANGQVMAFRRDVYGRLGGHGRVRAEVLEDVLFARRVKEDGERLGLALGAEFISVRMYRSYAESVRGFAKSILPMHGGQRSLLLLNLSLGLALYTWPLLRGQRNLVALALVEALGVRLLTGRTRPADLAEVALAPLTPLFAVPVVRLALRGQVEWKGRRYQN